MKDRYSKSAKRDKKWDIMCGRLKPTKTTGGHTQSRISGVRWEGKQTAASDPKEKVSENVKTQMFLKKWAATSVTPSAVYFSTLEYQITFEPRFCVCVTI